MEVYKHGASYWARFKDPRGKTRKLRLSKDKGVATSMAHKLGQLLHHVEAGDRPPSDLLEPFTAGDPQRLQRLVEWGIVDGRHLIATQDLGTLLEKYCEALANRGENEGYIGTIRFRVNAILVGCDFKGWKDINAESLLELMQKWRLQGKTPGSRRHTTAIEKTLKHYQMDFKGFCKWACNAKYFPEHPLVLHRVEQRPPAPGAILSIAAQRHPISDEELEMLVAGTKALALRGGMSGPARALLYHLGGRTGIRFGAIRRLTAGDIHPDGMVMARGSGATNKTTTPKWVQGVLLAELLQHAGKLEPNEPLFHLPALGMARVLRQDCDEIRSRWIEAAPTPEERHAREASSILTTRGLDFHCLRHTFCTALSRSGLPPKVRMALMDHKSMAMTDGIYTHTNAAEELAAIRQLGDLGAATTPRHNLRHSTLDDLDNLSAGLRGSNPQPPRNYHTANMAKPLEKYGFLDDPFPAFFEPPAA